MRDRRVIGHPPSINARPSQATGGKTTGIAALARTASSAGPRERRQLLAGEHVDGDDVKLDRHLLKPLVRGVLGDQTAQARSEHEVIARSEEAEQAVERTKRKHLPAPDAAPDLGQLVGCLNSLGRDAMNAPLIAPTEVPTIRSGTMPRSYSARNIPTCTAPRLAPPESTNATRSERERISLGVSCRDVLTPKMRGSTQTPAQYHVRTGAGDDAKRSEGPRKAKGHNTCFASEDTMSVNTLRAPIPSEASTLRRTFGGAREDPAYQAFALLRVGFTSAPIDMRVLVGR